MSAEPPEKRYRGRLQAVHGVRPSSIEPDPLQWMQCPEPLHAEQGRSGETEGSLPEPLQR